MHPNLSVTLTILQVLSTAVVGLIAWMGKRLVCGYDDRLKTLENQHVHREEFERMRQDVDDAVSKEEWLRSHGTTQQMIKQLGSKLDELNGKQTATFEIGTALAAALNHQRGEQRGNQ